MRLLVEGETTVLALEGLERYLEHGSLAVRLDATTAVLDAIRAAARAVTPADSSLLEADPSRLAYLAQTIVGVAASARALAAQAPEGDPHAAAVNKALGELNLLPLEQPLIRSVIVEAPQSGSWPALRFEAAGRLVGAYAVGAVNGQVDVQVLNTGVSGGSVVTAAAGATMSAGSVVQVPVDGAACYGAGELAVVNVNDRGGGGVSVQLDYQLD